jgi:hypothetical protein
MLGTASIRKISRLPLVSAGFDNLGRLPALTYTLIS